MNTERLHKKLYAWYEREKRVLPWRETADPYKIWLSEIILQQTRVAQGMDYYERFVQRFPTVEDLAMADEDEVMRLWQGLGYYSRARNLHKAAKMIMSGEVRDKEAIANSELYDGIFPRSFEGVRALPGVGEYTAGAICSFAYNMPYPAADGNVYRVLSRLYDDDTAFDTTAGKKRFREYAWQLLDRENARLFNSAIMEFGALYCTPTGMDCAHCTLNSVCEAYAHGTAELLPVRKERPKLRDRWLNYIIWADGEYTWIHQRTDKDIWQHLYEFVLIESDTLMSKEAVETMYGTRVQNMTEEIRHTLSHQRLHARFFYIKGELPESLRSEYIKIRIAALDDYALSRLTLKGLELIGKSI